MASRDARSDSLGGIFTNFSQNVDLVLKQIRDGEVTRHDSDSFSSAQYWNTVDGIFKKLSVETTKLSLAFSKEPFPSPTNTDALVTEIEKAMLSLASIFFTLPLTQGKVLRKTFQKSVVRVLERIHNFSQALNQCVSVSSKGANQRLTWTGSVWEATDFNIIKENKTCVLKEIFATEDMVLDALGEMEEAKESEGLMEPMLLGEEVDDNDMGGPTWSEQDKVVVNSCVGLVKATRTVVKKSRDCTKSSEVGVAVLDKLVDLTSQVSPLVDQFVCGIYAPVKYTEMKENGGHLVELLEKLLQFLRTSSLTNNTDESWLDFLHKAVNHNMEKLRESTQPDQGNS